MKLYTDLAEYYFFIENKHRNISNDVSLIKQLVPRNSRPKLLDLGCGTGEHLDLLKKEGFRCTGIDPSEEMIRVARMRNGVGITYEVSDMLNIDYYQQYDVVICLFGSFNYILANSDVDTVFYNTYRALKPGGIAVFEIWNAYPLHRIEQKSLGHVSTTYYKEKKIERERGFALVEKRPRTIVDVFYRYSVHFGGKVKCLDDKHRMRAYYQNEIERIIRDCGFHIVYRYASSLKEKFYKHSNKLIVIFERDE
ncbi:MAG: class I SAM-dependent methyltransferase [Spirochaetota bacterium]